MNESQPESQPEPHSPSGTQGQHPPAPAAQNAQPGDIARFVTTIKNVEQQVGEHVIKALQHGDTVAVITTVVIGPGGQQHIVSAALNPSKTAEVNALLESAAEEREEEVMCIGFHCLVKPKQE